MACAALVLPVMPMPRSFMAALWKLTAVCNCGKKRAFAPFSFPLLSRVAFTSCEVSLSRRTLHTIFLCVSRSSLVATLDSSLSSALAHVSGVSGVTSGALGEEKGEGLRFSLLLLRLFLLLFGERG